MESEEEPEAKLNEGGRGGESGEAEIFDCNAFFIQGRGGDFFFQFLASQTFF